MHYILNQDNMLTTELVITLLRNASDNGYDGSIVDMLNTGRVVDDNTYCFEYRGSAVVVPSMDIVNAIFAKQTKLSSDTITHVAETLAVIKDDALVVKLLQVPNAAVVGGLANLDDLDKDTVLSALEASAHRNKVDSVSVLCGYVYPTIKVIKTAHSVEVLTELSKCTTIEPRDSAELLCDHIMYGCDYWPALAHLDYHSSVNTIDEVVDMVKQHSRVVERLANESRPDYCFTYPYRVIMDLVLGKKGEE